MSFTKFMASERFGGLKVPPDLGERGAIASFLTNKPSGGGAEESGRFELEASRLSCSGSSFWETSGGGLEVMILALVGTEDVAEDFRSASFCCRRGRVRHRSIVRTRSCISGAGSYSSGLKTPIRRRGGCRAVFLLCLD